jgi:mannose-6-phosphate isomerase-like protein (cupin superfamily)
MKKSKKNSEHYFWGEKCEGWRMLDLPEFNVTREMIPTGKGEKLHLHKNARQFFYIISGSGDFEIGDEKIKVNQDEGIEIEPGKKHCISNNRNEPLEFIVISAPTTKGDRYEIT